LIKGCANDTFMCMGLISSKHRRQLFKFVTYGYKQHVEHVRNCRMKKSWWICTYVYVLPSQNISCM